MPPEKLLVKRDDVPAQPLLIHGIKWLFLLNIGQKLVTFMTNLWVLRSISIELTGAVSMSLDLYLSACLCLRDVSRLLVLRLNSGDRAQDFSPLWRWGNMGLGLGITLILTLLPWPHPAPAFPDWDKTRWYYAGAAALEWLSEPLYLEAHRRLDFQTKALAEGLAFTARALSLLTLVRFVHSSNSSSSTLSIPSLVFGQAQCVYALVWGGILWTQYLWQHSMADLFHHSKSKSSATDRENNDQEQQALAQNLVVQTLVKYVLTEGDKFVLNGFSSLEELGRYSLAFHWGSLAPRILFLPLEEVSKAIFSRRSDDPHAKPHLVMLSLMLKVVHYIGLSILAFGPAYTRLVLHLVLGPDKAHGTSTVLSWYCLYVAICAGNGILEAYVHSSVSAHQLMTLNGYLVLNFVLSICAMYVCVGPILGLGAVGIVLANCVNMIGRMGYCLVVIRERHGRHAFQWRQGLPDSPILSLFVLAFLVTQISQKLWLTSDAQLSSWSCIVTHLSIGCSCALLVVLVCYRQERRALIPQFLALRAHAHED